MKLMIDGVWLGDTAPPADLAAREMVHEGSFRHRIGGDHAQQFPAEAGRYHLYVSYACPFAHRTLVVHALKRLGGILPISVLHPVWDTPDGWAFGTTALSTPDGGGEGFRFLHQAYRLARPNYTGKVTVPVLWDRKTRQIVNNESVEIAALLNDAFDAVGADRTIDLYPADGREAIDTLNGQIRTSLAAGVYRVAQAKDQSEYDRTVEEVFGFLGAMERRMADGRGFLFGDRPSLSDVLIFTPLVRFDCVYNPHFRASRKRLVDYRALAGLTKRMHDLPGVAGTVWFDHIMAHYYDGDWAVANRHGIIPALPQVDFRHSPGPAGLEG